MRIPDMRLKVRDEQRWFATDFLSIATPDFLGLPSRYRPWPILLSLVDVFYPPPHLCPLILLGICLRTKLLLLETNSFQIKIYRKRGAPPPWVKKAICIFPVLQTSAGSMLIATGKMRSPECLIMGAFWILFLATNDYVACFLLRHAFCITLIFSGRKRQVNLFSVHRIVKHNAVLNSINAGFPPSPLQINGTESWSSQVHKMHLLCPSRNQRRKATV